MNLEELSNNYGGVVCDEWAHNLLRQWEIAIEGVRADSSIVWKKPLPPIHCVILNNSEVNAFAGKVNEGYVIGIFNGLRVLLSCFFSTLASDPRSFPAIGNIGLESPIDACFGKSLNSAIKNYFQVTVESLLMTFDQRTQDICVNFLFVLLLSMNSPIFSWDISI